MWGAAASIQALVATHYYIHTYTNERTHTYTHSPKIWAHSAPRKIFQSTTMFCLYRCCWTLFYIIIKPISNSTTYHTFFYLLNAYKWSVVKFSHHHQQQKNRHLILTSYKSSPALLPITNVTWRGDEYQFSVILLLSVFITIVKREFLDPLAIRWCCKSIFLCMYLFFQVLLHNFVSVVFPSNLTKVGLSKAHCII